jgi:hypothetical protein
MDTEDGRDQELVARLKRLDASATGVAPGFDYDRMLERHAAAVVIARRRLAVARGTAVGLLLAIVAASFWRVGERVPMQRAAILPPDVNAAPIQPRIVRADTYLAVAALEDHIASLDDALNVARARGGPADVARLERTRAELVTSYSQLRYAEMVSANF